MHRTLEQVKRDIDTKMKTTTNEVFKKILKDTRYAMMSKSRDLVYQEIGAYQMAHHLDAITRDEADFMRQVLIYDGLNNNALIPLE